mgnify:CR=1 FL=1
MLGRLTMDVRTLKNPDGTRADFNDISLESLGCHLLFGEVEDQSMKEAVTFLLKANQLFRDQELTLFVNSVGGLVSGGFSLIDIMDLSRLPVKTVASGNIMSMGVLIACAGHKGKRIMTRNTEVMAHQFYDEVGGKFHEIMARTKALEYTQYQFLTHFKRHSTMTDNQIKDILFGPSDRWLTPTECKKYGLIDHIIDELAPAPLAESPPVEQESRPHRSPASKTAARKKRS